MASTVKNWESAEADTEAAEPLVVNPYDEMEDETCLNAWVALEEQRTRAEEQQHFIAATLNRRMLERKAKEIPHRLVACIMKETKTVDQEGLLPLLELDVLTQEILDEGFTPKHTRTPEPFVVPAQFHLQKVNMWVRKYGDPVGDVVAAATTVFPSGVSIKLRKGK